MNNPLDASRSVELKWTPEKNDGEGVSGTKRD